MVRVQIKGNIGALANLVTYDDDDTDVTSSDDEVDDKIENDGFIKTILDDVFFQVILNSKLSAKEDKEKYFLEGRSIGEKYRYDESSSSSSSSSESDSSSSSSSNSSSDEDSDTIENPPTHRKRKIVKTKGELSLVDLPPIEDLRISVPEVEAVIVGRVSSVVEELVVVESRPNTPALDLDSVLFLDHGKRPLGRVFDVIGPINQPFYCVRFNSNADIAERKIVPGLDVYFAPRTNHTSYVFLQQLIKLKGSDASWKHDEEPPIQFLEYSDDEEERKAKQSLLKPKKVRERGNSSSSSSGNKYSRGRGGGARGGRGRNNNPFYRVERSYNPTNYGPIQWNTVPTPHTKHDEEPKPPGT